MGTTKKKTAPTKKASSKPPASPQSDENDMEGGGNTPQTLEGDDKPNLEAMNREDAMKIEPEPPDTDREIDPEPTEPDPEPERMQIPTVERNVKCTECSWKGKASALIPDPILNRPTYCPKCGTRAYDAVKDKDHGFRQFQEDTGRP